MLSTIRVRTDDYCVDVEVDGRGTISPSAPIIAWRDKNLRDIVKKLRETNKLRHLRLHKVHSNEPDFSGDVLAYRPVSLGIESGNHWEPDFVHVDVILHELPNGYFTYTPYRTDGQEVPKEMLPEKFSCHKCFNYTLVEFPQKFKETPTWFCMFCGYTGTMKV